MATVARGQYGNGGAHVAGAWRLQMDLMDQVDQMDKMGAPRDTPGVCGTLCGLAWAEMCRWGIKTQTAARLVKSQPPYPRANLRGIFKGASP